MSRQFLTRQQSLFLGMAVCLGLITLFILQPWQEKQAQSVKAEAEKLAQIQAQQAHILSAADQKMLAALRASDKDWTKAVIAVIEQAQGGRADLTLRYVLTGPEKIQLNGQPVQSLRLDLEIQAMTDPLVFAFLNQLYDGMPGVLRLTDIQIQKTDQPMPIQAGLSISLLRIENL